MPADVRGAVAALAIDGTSATALLVDGRSGEQLAAPKLYNESQPADVVEAVKVGKYPRAATWKLLFEYFGA